MIENKKFKSLKQHSKALEKLALIVEERVTTTAEEHEQQEQAELVLKECRGLLGSIFYLTEGQTKEEIQKELSQSGKICSELGKMWLAYSFLLADCLPSWGYQIEDEDEDRVKEAKDAIYDKIIDTINKNGIPDMDFLDDPSEQRLEGGDL